MKKLIIVLLFLVYLSTSIFYINMYEYKNTRNILWKDNQVCSFSIGDIQGIQTPEELIKILNAIAIKNNVNIYHIDFQDKTASNKRAINVYTTCNKGAFDNFPIVSGRFLKNNDLPNEFISSNKNNSKNQIGTIKFYNLNSEINIYNLYGVLYNGEQLGVWFVNTKDMNKLRVLKKDLENQLHTKNSLGIRFYPKDPDGDIDDGSMSVNAVNLMLDFTSAEMSMEVHHMQFHIISISIVLYIICFLMTIYWIFARYKELAIRKMFGESNISLKVKIILKELLKYHIYCLVLAGIITFSFLTYKLGLYNINVFFKDWLIFNLMLTVASLMLIFLPLIVMKYIKIPLMLKNKKPVQTIRKINYVFKVLIGVAAVTSIINCNNDLFELCNKKAENKVWDEALNYGLVQSSGVFDGTIPGWGDCEEVLKLNQKTKEWFKVCNKKGAIYINAYDYEYEDIRDLRTQKNIDDLNNLKDLQVNSNYLQINPIYDANGKQINIPDHDEHTLNLLVPEKYKKYDKHVREKYSDEFYSNKWKDYKLNIIYIKDNQKCFTFNTKAAASSNNYVIGSIIQVISNNNMSLDEYGECWCHGFYPKISNIENPYQDLLPDIKLCGVEKSLVAATTLYKVAEQDIYQTEQIFEHTIQLMILSITLLLILMVSMSINYLEENKIKNIIKKLHGEGFFRRSSKLITHITVMWGLSIILMLLINYESNLLSNVLSFFCMPYQMIFINKPLLAFNFKITYINWYLVAGVILTDITISMTILKIYENKKISSVLKGE